MVLWYGSHFLVIFPDFQILALVAPASRSSSRKTWLWWLRIASFASEAVAHRIWSGPQTTAGPRKTKRRREWNMLNFFGPQKARTGRNTARVSRGIEAENGDAQSHKFVDGCLFVRRLIYSACLPEVRAKEKSSISIGKNMKHIPQMEDVHCYIVCQRDICLWSTMTCQKKGERPNKIGPVWSKHKNYRHEMIKCCFQNMYQPLNLLFFSHVWAGLQGTGCHQEKLAALEHLLHSTLSKFRIHRCTWDFSSMRLIDAINLPWLGMVYRCL